MGNKKSTKIPRVPTSRLVRTFPPDYGLGGCHMTALPNYATFIRKLYSNTKTPQQIISFLEESAQASNDFIVKYQAILEFGREWETRNGNTKLARKCYNEMVAICDRHQQPGMVALLDDLSGKFPYLPRYEIKSK